MTILPHPLIDRATARDLLKTVTPYWTELLESLEASGGRLAFRSEFAEVISNLKIDAYPLLYPNEQAAGHLMAVAWMGSDGATEFDATLLQSTPEERGAALKELGAELNQLEAAFNFDQDPGAEARAAESFGTLSTKDLEEAVQFMQHMFMGLLVTLYQHLSIMVHGKKLTDLVAQAKNGDDDAFLKAIQIDKRILTRIPYFESRFQRAHTEGARAFITAVSRKLEAPAYAGKIAQKKIWLAFSFLDAMGLLDSYDGNSLLDLFEAVGVFDKRPVEDVKNLNKLKSRYREFQNRGGLSTPPSRSLKASS